MPQVNYNTITLEHVVLPWTQGFYLCTRGDGTVTVHSETTARGKKSSIYEIFAPGQPLDAFHFGNSKSPPPPWAGFMKLASREHDPLEKVILLSSLAVYIYI